MKILVTGGAGFVGKHLSNSLNKKDFDVIALDNLSNSSWEGIDPNVTCIENNVSRYLESANSKNIHYDMIFHLGEYSRVEQSFSEPLTVLDSNIKGTADVLKYCLKNKTKLIYAGSSTKFSHNLSREDSSPYSLTKSINTQLVKSFSEWYGLNYCISYFYNVYGEGEKREGKYATFIGICEKSFIDNKPIGITSPGTQTRNFTHIQDIISGLELIALKGSGDNYGIGHSEKYSVLEVANMFDLKVEMKSEKRGNRMSGEVITEKTKKLGWRQSINLSDYIQQFKNQYAK